MKLDFDFFEDDEELNKKSDSDDDDYVKVWMRKQKKKQKKEYWLFMEHEMTMVGVEQLPLLEQNEVRKKGETK